MPRITQVKLDRFNETQDISEDATLDVGRDAERDLSSAVESDYTGGMSHLDSTSDIGHAAEYVSGAVAAGMLIGATECAHVDAVRWAHAFNGTLDEVSAERLSDPYHDESWQAWHRENGTTCPSCEATNYLVDEVGGGIDHATCGNCLAPLAEGRPAGIEGDEFSDVVYGYVTALTWTDLMTVCESGHDMEVDGCEDCARNETGSEPYEYGPESLDEDLISEVRADVSGFLRANLSDCEAYVKARGPMVDHPQASGGGALPERECSGWEQLGHDLYLTAAGHGAGFRDHWTAPQPWHVLDDGAVTRGEAYPYRRARVTAMWVWAMAPRRALYELGERLSRASKPYTPPQGVFLDPSTGRISS